MPAWSYTALTAFETCPRRYFLTRVAKTVVEPPTDATKWGNAVHEALEARAKHGTPLPDQMQKYEPYVAKIVAAPGELLTEKQLAIDAAFHPVGWFDKAVWCRGIVDIGVINGDNAVLLDYKTGKRKDDHDQLELFSALVMAHYPAVKRARTGFIWLQANRLDAKSFTRNDVSQIWDRFLARYRRLELAYENNKWVPRPSGLCSKWCPVGRSRCEFCGSP